MVLLYPVSGGEPVAWSDDGRTYLSASGAVSGWRDGNTFYSDVGGAPLGWFCGDDFFSNDGKPIYFVALACGRSTPSCPGALVDEVVVDFQLGWGGDPEDVTITTAGDVSIEALNACTQGMFDDPHYRPGLRVLADYRLSEMGQLTGDALRRRADSLPDEARFGRHRVAFVVSTPADYGVVRMMQAYSAQRTDVEWHVGFDIDEARGWLKQTA
jgi:hypothetical protein